MFTYINACMVLIPMERVITLIIATEYVAINEDHPNKNRQSFFFFFFPELDLTRKSATICEWQRLNAEDSES